MSRERVTGWRVQERGLTNEGHSKAFGFTAQQTLNQLLSTDVFGTHQNEGSFALRLRVVEINQFVGE